jgi:putative phosphoesterase
MLQQINADLYSGNFAELCSAGQVRTSFDKLRTGSAPTRAVVIIGVISDTHGLLRPEALAVLRGSDYIVHAGDIGDPLILKTLAEIAPVTAIRGNVDREAWAKKIPSTNVLEVGGISIYVLHNLNQLDLKPEAAGFSVVVCGHSHVAKQETKSRVLYFNPGSAGPRRFRLPVTVGRLKVKVGEASGEIVEICGK